MDGPWYRPDLYALPAHLSPIPQCWSRDDVSTWAEWCRKEYSLEMSADKFQMNGKALCMLTKDDFKERAPEAGDVLYNTLQTLLLRASRSDPHARWSALHPLGSHGNSISWDAAIHPELSLPWMASARYMSRGLPACGRQSPPHSPITSSLPPHPDHAHSSGAVARPHAGFTPWSHQYGSSNPSPVPHSPSQRDVSDSEQTDTARPPEDITRHQASSEDKAPYIDVCGETSPNKVKYERVLPGLDTSSAYIDLDVIKKHSPSLPAGTAPAPVPLAMRLSPHEDVKVFENNGRTFHVKTEPGNAPGRLQMGLPFESDTIQQGFSAIPASFPYRRISPPSSPDSQTSQVLSSLPSAVEGERLTAHGDIMDKDELNQIETQDNKQNGLWPPQYPSGALPYIKGSRKLWEFLWGLMDNPSYKSVIRWEDKQNGTFRILNTSALAHLWGRQKNKDNMTYEKMSRALRYYYRMNILKKVAGKRLTYKFAKDPNSILEMKRWSRSNGTNKDGEEGGAS